MEQVIKLKNITKWFNEKCVLDRVSLTLKHAETIVLLGRSGGGKSVLLKTIVGLIDPEEGEVNVLGHDIRSLRESDLISLRRKVGYVFQDGALYDSLSVGENVAFSLKRQIKRKTDEEIDHLVMQALSRVGLQEAVDKMPDELSGGMRKRVALARTLILEPEIILYDEPTSALDPVTSKEIIRLILEMKSKFGISSIITTHDMICARMTADRILILNKGKIGAEGSYDELEKSKEPWIDAFFH
jgi:phospholipid/cholesterol/gamma-HCH transport system ATP-binding protein